MKINDFKEKIDRIVDILNKNGNGVYYRMSYMGEMVTNMPNSDMYGIGGAVVFQILKNDNIIYAFERIGNKHFMTLEESENHLDSVINELLMAGFHQIISSGNNYARIKAEKELRSEIESFRDKYGVDFVI